MFNAKLPSSEGTQHVLWLLLHSNTSHTCGLSLSIDTKVLERSMEENNRVFRYFSPMCGLRRHIFLHMKCLSTEDIFLSFTQLDLLNNNSRLLLDQSCYKFFAIFRKETMGFVSGYWVVGLNLKRSSWRRNRPFIH